MCNNKFVFKTHHFYDIRLQKCRDFEIGVRGHSRSLKVSPSMGGFLLVFFSNFVSKVHCFLNIRLQKYRDLENRVSSPSRSLGIPIQ